MKKSLPLFVAARSLLRPLKRAYLVLGVWLSRSRFSGAACSKMEQVRSFLYFLLFCLTSCTRRTNGVSPDIISIQSNSSCTVDNASSTPPQFCMNDNDSSCYRCTDTTSNINNIIDGLSDTVWTSGHVNELPNGRAEIYIEFNKV